MSDQPKSSDFPQRKPNETIKVNWENQVLRWACCDCALVHNIRFSVKGQTLTLRATINKTLTKRFRKI